MAEHFRASEGAGSAEPNGPDGPKPAPEAQVPGSGAPLPDGAPGYAPAPASAPAPLPDVSGQDGVPAPDTPVPSASNPQVTGMMPTFPQTPAPTAQPISAQQAHQQAMATQPSLQVTQPQPQPQQASAPTQAPARDLGYEPHGLYTSLSQESDRPPVNRTLEPTISMRHVTKIYPAQPHKPALEDVTLDIYPGEFVFIVGHSGSGKSTFLRLLTRELRVTSGDIMVAGQSLAKMRNWKVPFLRRQIGCVFQDFKLLQDRTTYENVAFSLECIGKPKSVIRAQVPEVLRLVGLADKMDMFPDQLSGGEQQRVSVARAMVNRPPLLICDEPTGNLDPAISLGIMKLLDAINRNGTTVIMATHDREMVDSMRKRVVALENGHLVRDQERGGYGFYGTL